MIRQKVIEAIERAKSRMKWIEAEQIPQEFPTKSAWLRAVNDIIDRTALAFVDELPFEPDAERCKGLYNFSPIIDGDDNVEPFISKMACGTCGNGFAGSRYSCTATQGRKHGDSRVELEICEDCYLWFFS